MNYFNNSTKGYTIYSKLNALWNFQDPPTKQKLKILSEGLFNFKLGYCLPFFCNTWDLEVNRNMGTRHLLKMIIGNFKFFRTKLNYFLVMGS